MKIYYAGVGARNTPDNILQLMYAIGGWLARRHCILRTGGADGADANFAGGAIASGGDVQLFLPWPGFNRMRSQFTSVGNDALEIASSYHPAWNRCTQGVKKLHARNVYQILGPDLCTPSSAVICWTPGGKIEGGTGMAIRIADAHGVPIFNLGGGDIEVVKSSVRKHFEERLP